MQYTEGLCMYVCMYAAAPKQKEGTIAWCELRIHSHGIRIMLLGTGFYIPNSKKTRI